jgi:hypothetical protein
MVSGGGLPTQRDRDRALLGHLKTSVAVNPLTPKRGRRRWHPKMLPDGARPELLDVVNTARDAMVVTWLSDTALRIGGLTGLHLCDLHLRENAACGECWSPHAHVCHRRGNANRAAAKKKEDWQLPDGVISRGEIYRVSPARVTFPWSDALDGGEDAHTSRRASGHSCGHHPARYRRRVGLELLDDAVLTQVGLDLLREEGDAEVGEVNSVAPQRRHGPRTVAGERAGGRRERCPGVDEGGTGGGRAPGRRLVVAGEVGVHRGDGLRLGEEPERSFRDAHIER